MDGGTIAARANLPKGRRVADDSDGNGTADTLWQDDKGQTAMWLMNGTTTVSGAAAKICRR
jgi:hypothetical protein